MRSTLSGEAQFAKLCASKRSRRIASSVKKRGLRLRTRDARGPLFRETSHLFTHVRSNPRGGKREFEYELRCWRVALHEARMSNCMQIIRKSI